VSYTPEAARVAIGTCPPLATCFFPSSKSPIQAILQCTYKIANGYQTDRYWGDSSPYEELNSETLQYLTLHQAILDFTYFAKTVDLPFDTDHSSNAQNAPWVYSGGSYSGALSAWTESVAPGTFWAYHSSSAPVEAIEDFVSKYNCLLFRS
jgi:hypothetical protein